VMLQIVVEVAGTASTSNFLVGEISLDAAAAVRLSVCLVSRSAMIAPSTRTSKSSARSDVGPWETGASRGHRSKHPPDNTTPQTQTPARRRTRYTQGEMTSQNLWPRHDRHFVGITWHNVWS